jgi:predicted phage tail protein
MAANPLRSEAAAFHWVLGTLVVAAVIVAASWISTGLGVAVTAVLAALGAWRLLVALRRRPKQAPPAERAKVEDTPDPKA